MDVKNREQSPCHPQLVSVQASRRATGDVERTEGGAFLVCQLNSICSSSPWKPGGGRDLLIIPTLLNSSSNLTVAAGHAAGQIRRHRFKASRPTSSPRWEHARVSLLVFPLKLHKDLLVCSCPPRHAAFVETVSGLADFLLEKQSSRNSSLVLLALMVAPGSASLASSRGPQRSPSAVACRLSRSDRLGGSCPNLVFGAGDALGSGFRCLGFHQASPHLTGLQIRRGSRQLTKSSFAPVFELSGAPGWVHTPPSHHVETRQKKLLHRPITLICVKVRPGSADRNHLSSPGTNLSVGLWGRGRVRVSQAGHRRAFNYTAVVGLETIVTLAIVVQICLMVAESGIVSLVVIILGPLKTPGAFANPDSIIQFPVGACHISVPVRLTKVCT